MPSASVQIQTVERKLRVATEDVVGTVRPKLSAAIEAKVSGRIEAMLVVPGQTVTNGEPLFVSTRMKFKRNLIRPPPRGSRRRAISSAPAI